MLISEVDVPECYTKRRKTIKRRKFSGVSTNLRSWKSLPDHLESNATQCWPQDHKTPDRPSVEKQEHLANARLGKTHLCRAASNAQMEYVLIRKAIEERNKLDLLNLLNRKYKDINALGADGLAALHHAAIVGTRRVIEVLLYFGAEINIQNSDGDYPLDLAVREGNYDIAQFLIEKGACLDNVVNGTPPRRQRILNKGRSNRVTSWV